MTTHVAESRQSVTPNLEVHSRAPVPAPSLLVVLQKPPPNYSLPPPLLQPYKPLKRGKNNRYNIPITIFHCVSSYPPNEEEINLLYIKKLVSLFPNYKIGYSGHERGYIPSLVSIFFGARVIERHLTLNKESKGPDHNSSLTKKEFGNLIFKSKIVFDYLNNNNTNLKKFLKTFKLLNAMPSIGKFKKPIVTIFFLFAKFSKFKIFFEIPEQLKITKTSPSLAKLSN